MKIDVKKFNDMLEIKLADAMTQRNLGRPKYWDGYIEALEDELAYSRLYVDHIGEWTDAGEVQYANPVMTEGYRDGHNYVCECVKECAA